MKRVLWMAVIVLVVGLLVMGSRMPVQAQDAPTDRTDIVSLGKAIFFDANLSANGTQACATCHDPAAGFTGPDAAINSAGAVYEGALPDHFGNRKPPAAAYAGDSPELYFDETEGAWFGGMFWDGRATGASLGDPLAEQAQGPFLNPLEQAVADDKSLCVKVSKASYAGLFEQVWGADSLDCAKDANGAFERIARSIAAYERSAEVSPFSSKFDLFWDSAKAAGKDVTQIKCGMGVGAMGMGMGGMGCAGGTDPDNWTAYRDLGFDDAELQGLAMFNDPNRANCASCHSLEPGTAGYPLFTDFGYENTGIPNNPDNPFYSMDAKWNPDGADWVDSGLGGFLKNSGKAPEVYEQEMGKFKVPTLRNVDKRTTPDLVKAYGHNGYFKSLEEIVFFYHWRGMMDSGMAGMRGGMGGRMADMFPPPAVDQNRAALGIFPGPQVNNIVAFLKTLSDGYSPN